MSPLSPALPHALSPTSSEEARRASALASAERTDKATAESANEESFTFSDFLSIINPLQHIPVVGSIYRAITGDTIKPAARVIGGALFGGPAGLIASAFNAMVEQVKGKDLGDQAIALLMPDKAAPPTGEPAAQFARAATSEPLPEAAPAPASPVLEQAAAAAPAPASRGLFTRSTPPQSPINVPVVGPDRTLGGSFLRGGQPNAAANPTQGRTIADYRSFSGRPLPVVDATRTAPSTSAQIRLQPTAPMSERTRALPLGATEAGPLREASPAEPETGTKSETGPGAPPAPANDWFASAMSRGLDRYREQRRQVTSPAPQIDTTL